MNACLLPNPSLKPLRPLSKLFGPFQPLASLDLHGVVLSGVNDALGFVLVETRLSFTQDDDRDLILKVLCPKVSAPADLRRGLKV